MLQGKIGIPNNCPWEAYHQNHQEIQGIPVPQSADPGIPVPGIDSDIALRKTPADAEHTVGTLAIPCYASAHSLGSA